MTASAPADRRLPRGRHGIPRETVVQDQRDRILAAMADAMAAHGYVGTSVAAVLKRAGVSRETFYEQFRSKEDCFEAAYERAVELLIARIQDVLPPVSDRSAGTGTDGRESVPDPAREPDSRPDGPADPPIGALLDAYLDGLASEPAYARLFLVEVYAAGPKAIARRAELQESFVSLVADILDARTDQQRFACRTMVAALSAMVTTHVAADDLDGLRELREPMLELVRRSGDLFGGVPADPGALGRTDPRQHFDPW
ncbi:TetR/AcrR family transcriptional regulator [Nocardia nova]|uniref:TetR/AcrR family transcriptional regulator n=1 Tax=Nocardia nova TaxID=37330 RepID=A0A2S6AV74_9NOCA|nr:TetR/AcrR family transcriptional regulator [Nocardia nova]PPJ22457.1 TetR/AcrR family transcriptional regulator [Nocardia nova]PPJ39131.1 TetR/AcrR family transcriptional regulator [Nocardia nova]